MKKGVALLADIAFSLAVGITVPPCFARTPAPKEEKKGEVMEKMDKKEDKK